MKQVGFRARLFLILLGFALIPTIVLAAAWELTVVRALPLLGTTPAMERIASTGRGAMSAARAAALSSPVRLLWRYASGSHGAMRCSSQSRMSAHSPGS